MAECLDCEERNPVTPAYSKAVPFVNENCVTCGDQNDIFTPPAGSSGSGKTTELIEGESIGITDISDSLVDRFIVAYAPIVQLAVTLTLKDKLDAPFPAISLFGVSYDEIRLSWVYNRPNDIGSQTLTNNGGIVPPVLPPTAVSHIYVGQNIQETIQYLISGDDSKGLPTSLASDAESIVFGNFVVWGEGLRRDQGSTTATNMVTFIEGLINGAGTKVLTTIRTRTLIGEGATVNDYFYYAYPARFGFATFFQNNFPGGWKRLANVAGNIVIAGLDSLEPGELSLTIDNGTGAEAFYVYQTASGQAAGAEFDVR